MEPKLPDAIFAHHFGLALASVVCRPGLAHHHGLVDAGFSDTGDRHLLGGEGLEEVIKAK
jgi:hypothetical protein